VGVVIPAYNEAESLDRLLPEIPKDLADLVLVIDDASTDQTSCVARRHGAALVRRKVRGGPGPAIRQALSVLRAESVDLAAVMASNGKHDPRQLPDLLNPLARDGLDLIRGSRFLPGGGLVNMPWHRLLLIQLFSGLVSVAAGQRVTDGTGGFQAYRLDVLDDHSIDLHQPWLGRYEVETYLFMKMLLNGYRWKEVPVRITYPRRGRTYTRARPVIDWWRYFRPVVLLRLGLKR
jgi:dolichol-phosphate mannosyltransferase